jgi:hypothetical protein
MPWGFEPAGLCRACGERVRLVDVEVGGARRGSYSLLQCSLLARIHFGVTLVSVVTHVTQLIARNVDPNNVNKGKGPRCARVAGSSFLICARTATHILTHVSRW